VIEEIAMMARLVVTVTGVRVQDRTSATGMAMIVLEEVTEVVDSVVTGMAMIVLEEVTEVVDSVVATMT